MELSCLKLCIGFSLLYKIRLRAGPYDSLLHPTSSSFPLHTEYFVPSHTPLFFANSYLSPMQPNISPLQKSLSWLSSGKTGHPSSVLSQYTGYSFTISLIMVYYYWSVYMFILWGSQQRLLCLICFLHSISLSSRFMEKSAKLSLPNETKCCSEVAKVLLIQDLSTFRWATHQGSE